MLLGTNGFTYLQYKSWKVEHKNSVKKTQEVIESSPFDGMHQVFY